MDDNFDAILKELKDLPTINKSAKAIAHKKTLLYVSSRIPQVLSLLIPDEQLAFLMASKDEINAPKLAAAVAHLTNVAHRHEFIADQESKINDDNLVAIAVALCPEPKDRMAFITARKAKVTESNFLQVANILVEEDKETFILAHSEKFHTQNLLKVLAFISPEQHFAFLQEHLGLVDSINIVKVVGLLALELREAFIKLKPATVTSHNLAALSALLPEKSRMMFTANEHKAQITSGNMVEVAKTLGAEHLTVLVVQRPDCIVRENFAEITALLPEDLQLEFFNSGIKFLTGKPAGIWVEAIGKLKRAAERNTLVLAHQEVLIRQDDIFSVVWAMEILAAEDAVKFAKLHFDKVKSAGDFISLVDCKVLDFANKLALIEAYKPQMLKQTDVVQQTFEVRKYLAKQLSEVTGKQYPRGERSDLQALNFLINVARAHLGIKTSSHDVRAFGGSGVGVANSAAAVQEVTREMRFTA